MQTILRNLLDRMMTTKDVVTNSEQSTSWRAHREAEGLSDETFIDELEVLLSVSKSKDERRSAYFILGAIGANVSASRCSKILIERSELESDKYVLSSLLDCLSKINKPADQPLDPIYRLLNESRWLVRRAAIGSLKNTNSLVAEEHVLAHLVNTNDLLDITCCHSTLNQIGTSRSIPQISLSLISRKRDVRLSAEAAIRSIQSRHGIPAR